MLSLLCGGARALSSRALRAPATARAARRTLRRAAAPAVGATAHAVSAGDHVRVDWRLATKDGAPLDAAELVFDLGEVDVVVGEGDFLPALHGALAGAELAVGVPEATTVKGAFGDRDARLGPLKVPAANAPKGMKAGDLAGLSNGMMARVISADEATVVIDANHIYAGQDLDLTVTLLAPPNADALETATVAGGCFWGLELAYQREPGVVSTKVGYAQGADPAPTYEAVCSGATGHTEAVRVRYDPARVSFERLCDLLLDRLGENRYALNRVGNDQGTQYRHGIYPHSEAQRATAEAVIAREQERDAARPIVTEVEAAAAWFDAEDYHQQYLQVKGQSARKNDAATIRCYG